MHHQKGQRFFIHTVLLESICVRYIIALVPREEKLHKLYQMTQSRRQLNKLHSFVLP